MSAPIHQFGGIKVLEKENLAQPHRPKRARKRREPKLYVLDNAAPGKFLDNLTPEQNDAAIDLDQAIAMGLVKAEDVNMDTKLEFNPDDIEVEPTQLEEEKPVALAQDLNKQAEQKIAQAVAQAPQVAAPQPVEQPEWEDPRDNLSPDEILQELAHAIQYERDCGEKIHLVDQDGNKILGLNIVREKPKFVGM